MRVVMVESDGDGRSSVGRVLERGGSPVVEAVHEIFAGPLVRTVPPGLADEFLDMSPGQGAAQWRIFEFPPRLSYEMHHTDTIDFDVVVDGSMTLELDSERVELIPGNAVLLRGDRHAWHAGVEGCRMLFALLGVVNNSGDETSEAV